MTQLDTAFVRNCKDILHRGYSDEGLEVRPHWEDGTPAHTQMIFNRCNTYNLREEPIPILTLRQTNFKACVDEILWIYQKCSNNVKDLNSHIWDSWADEHGSIGKAYGYQIAQRFRHHIYAQQVHYRKELRRIKTKLDAAGIQTRTVYWSQIDKEKARAEERIAQLKAEIEELHAKLRDRDANIERLEAAICPDPNHKPFYPCCRWCE